MVPAGETIKVVGAAEMVEGVEASVELNDAVEVPKCGARFVSCRNHCCIRAAGISWGLASGTRTGAYSKQRHYISTVRLAIYLSQRCMLR